MPRKSAKSDIFEETKNLFLKPNDIKKSPVSKIKKLTEEECEKLEAFDKFFNTVIKREKQPKPRKELSEEDKKRLADNLARGRAKSIETRKQQAEERKKPKQEIPTLDESMTKLLNKIDLLISKEQEKPKKEENIKVSFKEEEPQPKKEIPKKEIDKPKLIDDDDNIFKEIKQLTKEVMHIPRLRQLNKKGSYY